jgi:hypothetical protein
MPYRSEFYGVDVRDEIAREFTDEEGHVDDMLAGLHEIRARLMSDRSRASSAKPADRDEATSDSAAPEAPGLSRSSRTRKS